VVWPPVRWIEPEPKAAKLNPWTGIVDSVLEALMETVREKQVVAVSVKFQLSRTSPTAYAPLGAGEPRMALADSAIHRPEGAGAASSWALAELGGREPSPLSVTEMGSWVGRGVRKW
jgi:hypothetical protein